MFKRLLKKYHKWTFRPTQLYCRELSGEQWAEWWRRDWFEALEDWRVNGPVSKRFAV